MDLFSKSMKTIYEYIAILIIYIYSFVYLTFEKVELSSLNMLFFIQIIFTLYCFSKSYFFTKYKLLPHTGICVAGMHITNIFLLVSLILVFRLVIRRNNKLKGVRNESLDLPKKSYALYKNLFIACFSLIFATFVGLTAGFELINKDIELDFNINNLIPIFFVCCSLASIGMSSYMVYIGNDYLGRARRTINN